MPSELNETTLESDEPDGRCPFAVNLTDDEIKGLDWLGRVLENIRNTGPKHNNYQNAKNCVLAINKLSQYQYQAHKIAHWIVGKQANA